MLLPARAMAEGAWYCVRQRAGPLVKECRALRPSYSKMDTPDVRKEKAEIKRNSGDSSVCRTRRDRLELRLALFGQDGVFYTLTFDREHNPQSLDETRRRWKAFLYQLRKWTGHQDIDYIYLIEGRHGDHRYHIHAVLRESQFPPAVVRYLWPFGTDVDDQPLLRGKKDSYARLAEYMNKEKSDGVVLPLDKKLWVVSRSLRRQLPPLEKWRSDSGVIEIPPGAIVLQEQPLYRNRFGCYTYAKWFVPPLDERARARANNLGIEWNK